MMNDFIVSPKGGVLIQQCVQAVRTGRDDRLCLHCIERLNVGAGQLVEEILIT